MANSKIVRFVLYCTSFKMVELGVRHKTLQVVELESSQKKKVNGDDFHELSGRLCVVFTGQKCSVIFRWLKLKF